MGARASRPLSRERVLSAALELADAEGLSAVTMRRVAAELGVEAMSLYHHLPGKDALLDGLVEAVVTEIDDSLGELHPGGPPEDWRAALRGRFLTARTVMVRHPWAPALVGSRTSIPPSVYGHYEAILATLVDAGFSYHLAHRALHAFGSMPLGFVQELFSPDSSGAANGGADADPDKAKADLEQMAAALPHITAMVASEMHASEGNTLGWCDSQAEYEFTLDLLLDGLDRHLGQR